jgi:hypothetical protein
MKNNTTVPTWIQNRGCCDFDLPGGVADLAQDRGYRSVMGGAVGEAEAVELCLAVVGPAGAAAEVFGCAPAIGGLGVCSAGFEDAAGAEQGGNGSKGKTTEFTTEGSSRSLT